MHTNVNPTDGAAADRSWPKFIAWPPAAHGVVTVETPQGRIYKDADDQENEEFKRIHGGRDVAYSAADLQTRPRRPDSVSDYRTLAQTLEMLGNPALAGRHRRLRNRDLAYGVCTYPNGGDTVVFNRGYEVLYRLCDGGMWKAEDRSEHPPFKAKYRFFYTDWDREPARARKALAGMRKLGIITKAQFDAAVAGLSPTG